MFKQFIEIMNCSGCLAGSRIIVAAADRESIEATRLAMLRGLGHAILVGNEAEIIPVVKEFFSDPYDPLKSQKYHTNIAGIYGAHKLEQLYIKGPDRDLIKLQEVRENRGKELRMYSQAQDVERQLKSLRVRLRTAQNRGDAAREKELRDRIGKIQERFNNVYQQRMG